VPSNLRKKFLPSLSHSRLLAPEAFIITVLLDQANQANVGHCSLNSKAKICGVYAPSPHTGETPGLHHFLREHLQNLGLCSPLVELPPKCSEF
jgi:hypothetical protein